MPSLFSEIRSGAVLWRVDCALVEPFARWLGSAPGARTPVRDGRHRAVWKVPGVFPSGMALKEIRPRGPLRRLRRLLPGLAGREWENALELHAMGGLAPRPVAFGTEGRSGPTWLASEWIDGSTLEEYLRGGFLALDLTARRAFLDRLGRFLHDLAARSVEAKDLHCGNVLMEASRTGAGPRLFLIDLADVRVGKGLSARALIHQAALFLASLGPLSSQDRLRIARSCANTSGVPVPARRAFFRRVDREIWRLWRARWASRTRRCRVASGAFEVRHGFSRSVYRRREFSQAQIDCAIAAFHEALSGKGGSGVVKKDAPESAVVSGIDCGLPARVCVKMYRSGSPARALGQLGRRARGIRGWVAANGMLAREAGAARPWALVTLGWGPWRPASYLVSQDLSPARELDRWLCAAPWKDLPAGRRLEWARSLGRELRRLHRRGIHIGDAKSCNLFVCGDDPSSPSVWRWVDVDGIRFLRGIGVPGRIACLLQLHLSVPAFVSPRDRLRFFAAYAAGMRRAARRSLLRAVERLGAHRRILYVGLEGDVEEGWKLRTQGGEGRRKI